MRHSRADQHPWSRMLQHCCNWFLDKEGHGRAGNNRSTGCIPQSRPSFPATLQAEPGERALCFWLAAQNQPLCLPSMDGAPFVSCCPRTACIQIPRARAQTPRRPSSRQSAERFPSLIYTLLAFAVHCNPQTQLVPCFTSGQAPEIKGVLPCRGSARVMTRKRGTVVEGSAPPDTPHCCVATVACWRCCCCRASGGATRRSSHWML